MEFTVPLLVVVDNRLQIFYGEVVQEENIWKSICLKVKNSYFEHSDLHSCLIGLIENIKINLVDSENTLIN